jgi:hypothetical protein
MTAGTIMMWVTKSRPMICSEGNSPPKIKNATQVPINGIDNAMEYAIRNPVPDKRSSGNEYPVNPLKIAKTRSVTPRIQLSSRGRRNAPVKKIRQR